MPNSGMLVLPSRIRPAASKRATSVASKVEGAAGTKREPCRVGQPFLKPRMPFKSIGTPAKAPESFVVAFARASS